MGASITLAGESLIAQRQAAKQTVNVSRFVLALVPNLDPNAAVNRAAAKPAAAQIKGTYNVTQSGYVNPNQVVYSLMLGSDIGDFDFNWIGLETADNVLLAVAYLPTQQKRKNLPPLQLGNNVTRNFLVEFDGAQALTAVTIDAKTWQHDFTARLHGIDERERLSNREMFGRACFFDTALQLEKVGNAYRLKPGIAYIEGIRIERTAVQAVTVASTPSKAWLDVVLQRELSDVVGTFQVVFGATKADYTDTAGAKHYLVPLADLPSSTVITDLRTVEPVISELIKHFAARVGDYPSLRARATTKSDVGLSLIPNAISDAVVSDSSEVLATTKMVQAVRTVLVETMINALAQKLNLSGGRMTGELRTVADIAVATNSHFRFNETNAGIGWGVTETSSDGYLRFRTRTGEAAWADRFYSDLAGNLTARGYNGSGEGLTNLNASRLSSGVVPDACLNGTYSGVNITGNAGTATKLAAGKNIALTGSVVGDVTTDLSGNVSLATSIARISPTVDISATFRATVFGGLTNGLRVIRSGIGGLPNFPQYGPCLAWSTDDTHALLSVSYNTGTARLSAGAGAGITWTRDLAFLDSSITGNAATADRWRTARTINGVPWDGSGNITIVDSSKLPLAGGTITGRVITGGDRDSGIYGNYNPALVDHVWSMGNGYRIAADGGDFGTLYGMAYKHTTNTAGGAMAGGHQIVFCSAGSPGVAIGLAGNIWNSGTYYGNGAGLTDIPQSGVAGLVAGLNSKAPLASPSFTGVPTAPTQATADSSTRLATTAFVKNNLAAVPKNTAGLSAGSPNWWKCADTGLITQFGRYTGTGTGSPLTVTFPVAFPNECTSVVLGADNSSADHDLASLGKASFVTRTSSNIPVCWVAYGY